MRRPCSGQRWLRLPRRVLLLSFLLLVGTAPLHALPKAAEHADAPVTEGTDVKPPAFRAKTSRPAAKKPKSGRAAKSAARSAKKIAVAPKKRRTRR